MTDSIPPAAPLDHLCNYKGFGALSDVCPACEIEAAAQKENGVCGVAPWDATSTSKC